MSLKRWLSAALLLALAPAVRGDDVDQLPDYPARAYRVILPRENEMRWQEIPWLVDLAAAAKLAKKEKRPLLVWVSGDEPLERC
jgi:hypothetical protein